MLKQEKLTVAEVRAVRERLHCSLREAIPIAKREKMLKQLDIVCDSGQMSKLKGLLTEIVTELFKRR